MDERFRKLIELGAGDFEQADAQLIAHLEGCCCLLKEWHACEALQQAGLFHLAYGSSLKADCLVEKSHRQDVATVIGAEAENIVYHYFTCLKAGLFDKIDPALFCDPISKNQSDISPELLFNLSELLAAKEIDLLIYQADYADKHAKRLKELFSRLQDFLSPSAKRKLDYVFAGKA